MRGYRTRGRGVWVMSIGESAFTATCQVCPTARAVMRMRYDRELLAARCAPLRADAYSMKMVRLVRFYHALMEHKCSERDEILDWLETSSAW